MITPTRVSEFTKIMTLVLTLAPLVVLAAGQKVQAQPVDNAGYLQPGDAAIYWVLPDESETLCIGRIGAETAVCSTDGEAYVSSADHITLGLNAALWLGGTACYSDVFETVCNGPGGLQTGPSINSEL